MKIVFLSDSNGTENYVSGAANMVSIVCARFGAVKVNSSVSGNTVAQMTARVSTDVLAHSPDLVIVMAGTNDGALAFENDISASVWIPDYLSDMGDLIDAVASVPKIIIASPVPARRYKLCVEWPTAIAGLIELCASKGVVYCPMYEGFASTAIALMGYAAPTQYYFADPDRYHLLASGHTLAAAIIGDCYEQAFAS